MSISSIQIMTTTILITSFGRKEEQFSNYPKATSHLHFFTGIEGICMNFLHIDDFLISTLWPSLAKVNISSLLITFGKESKKKETRERDHWRSKMKIWRTRSIGEHESKLKKWCSRRKHVPQSGKKLPLQESIGCTGQALKQRGKGPHRQETGGRHESSGSVSAAIYPRGQRPHCHWVEKKFKKDEDWEENHWIWYSETSFRNKRGTNPNWKSEKLKKKLKGERMGIREHALLLKSCPGKRKRRNGPCGKRQQL